jgi:hypothetical protein
VAALLLVAEIAYPKLNLATAPRAKPTAIANITSRTFLAALLSIFGI